MKYNGFNIIEIEKVKGTVYQLDMTVDGKRVRRNFSSLQDAKDEADRIAIPENHSVLNEKSLNKDDLLRILKESGVGIDEITNFLKTDLASSNISTKSEK